MDASGASQGGGNDGGSAKSSQTVGVGNNASGAKLRKRTKTGCLTCRKRRIKCGEERPVCANCTKSKRACEGYNQRLNWKPPIDWPVIGDDGQALQYHNGMLGPNHYRPVPPPINTDPFMPIRMQQGQPYAMAENGEAIFSPPHTGGQHVQNFNGLPITSPHTPFPPQWTPITPQYGQQSFGQSPMTTMPPPSFATNFSAVFQQAPTIPSRAAEPVTNGEQLPTQYHQQPQMHEAFTPNTSSGYQHSAPAMHGLPNAVPPSQMMQSDPDAWWDGSASANQQANGGENAWSSPVSNGETVSPNFTGQAQMITPAAIAPDAAQHLGPSITGIAAQLLQDAAIERFDDNYYDVEPDEEMDDISENASRQLTLMRQLHEEHFTELSMRRYDTFLYSGILVNYVPEEHANPLNNPTTARVFAHFISATGPSLSIFERHPRNPSALFNDTFSDHQQGIWTYTLPMKAMYNQGLLQAMLALASLHISKLQNIPGDSAFRHYAFAIKNIHKRVGNPKQRLLPTTIAATLLLGFYEILTADHLKWCNHLAGAKVLLMAIDFRGMAKEAQRVRAQQLAQKDQYGFYENGFSPVANDLSPAIDENLVSNLMGKQVKFEQFGHVLGEEDESSETKPSKPFDMEKYELYQDLYWWYARQDVYQAILSGNRLLLDYNRWTDCPPRANMGRSDAIFGTHDHLILLFARIADFNARDRRRKIKVMAANGGQWRPPPGMNLGGPPGQGPPQGMAQGNPQGPPPGMSQGPPHGMPQGPPPGIPMHLGNPNAGFMNSNASQNNAGMPPLPFGQPMPPQGVGGPPSNPSMQWPPGVMPPDFANISNGAPVPQFTQGGPLPETPMGPSPNFRQERAFAEASPNAPYSVSTMGPPPSQGPGDIRRGSMGAPGAPPPPPQFYGMAPLPTTVNLPSSYASHGGNATPSPKSEKGEVDTEFATQNALKEWQELKTALSIFESNLGPHFQPMPADVHPATMTPFGPALFYRSHDVGIIWAMYYMACIILERAHPHMPPAAMMAAGVAARQTAPFAQRIGQIVGGIVPPVMGPDLSPNLGACLCESSLPLFFAGVQYQDPDQRTWLVSLLRNVEARTGWKSIGMVAQGCETAWEKAFEMKRGPPYKRKFDQWHADTAYDSRVARITGNYTAIDQDHPDIAPRVMRDAQGARVHWAMGILGVSEDGDEKESRHVSGVQPSKAPID